ncbi:MAG: T9SS type A sorting domain-containing protein [Lewinellaceae bacterium]|nr:T9SS type A sorting domain-containing protein [Saprospiraceae bacterium]MCB9336617.1 T9SS type A sorting domain-containing protein [Lewinellaceae bacterium]
MKKAISLTLLSFLFILVLHAQHSVARLWNDAVLDAIRSDFARPTVHARNLFHTSVAMYEAWAVYSETGDTYLLGKTLHGFNCLFTGAPPPQDVKAAQEEAISFAVYRIMRHRFANSPGKAALFSEIDGLMDSLGYDRSNVSINYKCGPAEMGNYIAAQIIAYGLQDGSNEAGAYQNKFYKPVNPPLVVQVPGNPNVLDLNRWQPLTLDQIIDQSGNPVSGNTQTSLSPEWGGVLPFSLQPSDAKIYQRDGHAYWVYHDPGPPPQLDTEAVGGLSEEYKWGHELVSVWSSQLDPSDGVLWDISPASIGNIQDYPTGIVGLRDFYDLLGGGDTSPGHALNPKTGQPYQPQIVPRGDYARVLAEFWADGPTSETPPGHWFTILNYVSDNPLLVKKMRGQGPVLDDLEWDVKAYFALGGAMHDVAITAWGIKGWYDSSRPVTALRGMAELGQSSDPNLPNYHPGGLQLIPGYVELIQPGDTLQGPNGFFVGEVKVLAWQGPNFVDNPGTDVAGVGWILAKNWWSFQRPTFVTPPFAGYISGHSTYSRAGAEVLTALTGDPFFPGGMGEFFCKKNEFLVFEDGPSLDLTLQWATYRDASDQCSLSRIWGGIHPPFDDMPGRLIGREIGVSAFDFAEQYFNGEKPEFVQPANVDIYPNPTTGSIQILTELEGKIPTRVFSGDGRTVISTELEFCDKQAFLDLSGLSNGVYMIVGFEGKKGRAFEEKVILVGK